MSALAVPIERGVDQAVAVHISAHGLDTLGDAVEAALSTSFPVEATTDTFECSDDTTILYALSDVDVLFSADEVAIVPSADRLDITVYATLSSTPATLDVIGECAVLTLWEQCGVEIQPTAVEVGFGLTLAEVNGAIEATADPLDLYISPVVNPLSDCTLESAVGTLLGQNASAVNDLLLSAIEPALADVPTQAETAIEEAFGSLAFDTSIDLLGTPLGLSLAPTRVTIDDNGVVLGLGGTVTSDAPGQCVDALSVPVPEPEWPVIDGTAAGTSLAYDAGVYVGADFVDELLVGVWASELFCMDLDGYESIVFDDEVIGVFFGDEASEILDDDTAVSLRVNAPNPPKTEFAGDQPVARVVVDPITIDLIGQLDHRQMRLLGVEVEAEIGIDLGLNDGAMAPTIVLDDAGLNIFEAYSEIVGPGYSGNLGALIDPVLGAAIPTDPLVDLVLPQPMGVRVGALIWDPVPNEPWLGGYAVLDIDGVQPIQLSGCSASSFSCDGSDPGIDLDMDQLLGCDSMGAGGCEGAGCGVVVPAGPLLPVFSLLVLVGLRRRD